MSGVKVKCKIAKKTDHMQINQIFIRANRPIVHKFYGESLPLTLVVSEQTFQLMLKPSSVI